jgi:hypothetical protein
MIVSLLDRSNDKLGGYHSSVEKVTFSITDSTVGLKIESYFLLSRVFATFVAMPLFS